MKTPAFIHSLLVSALLAPALPAAGVPDLTGVMEAAAPGLKLRGTVMAVETREGQTTFPTWHYKNEPDATDFWPAEAYHQDYYLKNPVRYNYYRTGCGRDARLKALWGSAPK